MGNAVKRGKMRGVAFRRALFGALLLIMPLLIFMSLIFLSGRIDTSFDRDIIRAYGDLEAPAPKLHAEAAALYSLDLDSSVYEKNGDKKIDPYSITKILTCYLALNNLDPKQKVVISAKTDEQVYEDGAYLLLFEGEEMTVDDLLHGTMLSSANDAAYALAELVAGSEGAFAEMMNEQAREWGCENTNFVNSNGWKHKDHYTTAHDMAVIAARCFENEDLRKLSMEEEYSIPATNKFEQRDLFSVFRKSTAKIDNIICGKTGSWEDDDCSIALEFSEDNLTAVIVLLRDSLDKRPSDIKKLKEFSHRVTPGFIAAEEGDKVCKARVKGGSKTETELAIDSTLFAYPKDRKADSIKVEVENEGIEAPVRAGDSVGTYIVTCDGREIGKGSLIATEDIEEGWLLSQFYISDRDSIMGASVIALVFCLLLIIKAAAPRSKHRRKS